MNPLQPQFQRQQGYSIVEIAIVLVALSTLATGALWAFSRQYEDESYDSTLEYMQALEDAVVNYAYTHRTRGDFFNYSVFPLVLPGINPDTALHISAGRPVLPCPDLDGDGYEDRTSSTTISGLEPGLQSMSYRDSNVDLIAFLSSTYGRCVDDKGFFPYRTLRTKPADPWGNYFTYWVDATNFAHASLGFDQTSKGSALFPFMAIALSRLSGGGVTGADYAVSFDYRPSGHRGLMRDNGFNHLFASGYVLQRQDTTNYYAAGCSNNCDYALIAGDPLEEKKDALTSSSVDRRDVLTQANPVAVSNRQLYANVYSGANYYPMKNGIAFAIVSHGPNGNGAANFLSNNDSRSTLACNRQSTDEGELINARRTVSCPIKAYPQYPSNCTNGTVANFSNNCQNSNRSRRGNGIFVYGTRSLEFDDIVTWMHPTELITRLIKLDALPIELPRLALIP